MRPLPGQVVVITGASRGIGAAFGKVRTGVPLAGKVYALDFAVDKFVQGIGKRSRVVHVPGWIGSRFRVPKADPAALAYAQDAQRAAER
jgi:NAD(P)-dependent dehydrogenase (short-subunit alcohol dehydrogenase family)